MLQPAASPTPSRLLCLLIVTRERERYRLAFASTAL